MIAARAWFSAHFLFLASVIVIAELGGAMHLQDFKYSDLIEQRHGHIARGRTKRRKDSQENEGPLYSKLRIRVSRQKIVPTAEVMISDSGVINAFTTPSAKNDHKVIGASLTSRQIRKGPFKRQPLPKKENLKKPCTGCAAWKPKVEKDKKEEVNLMIMPMAGLLAFICIVIVKCIEWCNEDIQTADDKFLQISTPPTPASIRSSPMRSSRTRSPRSPRSGSTSLSGSPYRTPKQKHFRKSRITPERQNSQASRGSEESSLEDVRGLDPRHRRPPAMAAAASASPRSLKHKDLRRQLSLDKTKPQWGVYYDARRRDSDSSSGIASGSVVQVRVESHSSPKDLSSPSSLGYVSRSESFAESASPVHQARSGLPLSKRVHTNSDLQLARALLQLQRLSMSMGGVSVDGSQSLPTMSTTTSSTATIHSPIVRSRASESDTPQTGPSSLVASPAGTGGHFEADTSSVGTDDFTVPDPSRLGYDLCQDRSRPASQDDSCLSEDLGFTMSNSYYEDPFIIATPYTEFDLKHPLRFIPHDSTANSSGVSSKHSSYCSSEGDKSFQPPFQVTSRLLRGEDDDTSGSKSSFWTSIDSLKGRGGGTPPICSILPLEPPSSTSASQPQLANAAVFYTIACVHDTPTDSTESVPSREAPCDQPHDASRDLPCNSASHDPDVIAEASRDAVLRRELRSGPRPVNGLHKRISSKELLQKLGKFAHVAHSKRKDRPCHSWCVADTVDANNTPQTSSAEEWRRSLFDEKGYDL